MPHSKHLKDATAKALDLLPHDDPARSDPRLARDAKCLEEIRATQEAAADVWLATSPLRAAPPEVLSSIMSKVEARTPLAARHVKFFPWLAASGWVAAAVAFLLWPRGGERAPQMAEAESPVALPSQIRPDAVARPAKSGEPADRRMIPEDRRTREELLRYQAQVNALEELGAADAPRILSLHSPNALLPAPGEVQRRMVDKLVWLMHGEGGIAGDPAQFLLTSGWVSDEMVVSAGKYIRHLNFPPNAVEDHDLLVSHDGAYYDKANDLIWFQDENGFGFIGRRTTEGDDLTAFHPPDERSLASNRMPVNTEAQGVVVEDPMSNTAKVLIDQVKPPEPGYEQMVVWTNAQGNETRIPVANTGVSATPGTPSAPVAPAEIPSPAATTHGLLTLGSTAATSIPVLPSLAQAGTNRLLFSLPDSNGVKSFSLIEVPIIAPGAVTTTPVAPKVIVSGTRQAVRSRLR